MLPHTLYLHGYKVHTRHCRTALGLCGRQVSNNAMYNNYKHINWGKPERAPYMRVGWRFSLVVDLSVIPYVLIMLIRICNFYFYSIQNKYFFNAEFLLIQAWPQCPAFQLVVNSGTYMYPLQNGAMYTH